MASKSARAKAPKRTPTGGRAPRVCLLARPVKPPVWWPSANEGWVTVMGNGQWAAGWTLGVDRRHGTSARRVDAKKECFLDEMSDLDVGGWEFTTK